MILRIWTCRKKNLLSEIPVHVSDSLNLMVYATAARASSCCRRSGKQDHEGPRIKRILKTALKKPKMIALTGLPFANFWTVQHSYVQRIPSMEAKTDM
jgi:hypothetical protein